jgi:hypothetical protein
MLQEVGHTAWREKWAHNFGEQISWKASNNTLNEEDSMAFIKTFYKQFMANLQFALKFMLCFKDKVDRVYTIDSLKTK